MAKHIHRDIIIKWANDTSKEIQVRNYGRDWFDALSPTWNKAYEYRLKPREFKDGWWYPVITKDGTHLMMVYFDGAFRAYKECPNGVFENNLKRIDEGIQIDFGDK